MRDDAVMVDGGRRLAYRVAGPDDGFPVLFFHGLAQSRLTMHPDESIVEKLGIRLIVPDRPGVGLSDPCRRRRLRQWPADVTALADHLECPRFAIFGHSAGAPYVVSCAHAMPERVLSATIVSGMSEPSVRLCRALFASEFWKITLFLFLLPPLTRPVLSAGIRYSRPRAAAVFERHLANLPPADRAAMADPAVKQMRIDSMLEAFRQGAEGVCEDVAILRRSWGLDFSSIQVPVRILHGEEDPIVNVSLGRELARRLPDCQLECRPGVGHNMLFSQWEEILAGVRDDALNRQTVR